MGKKGRALQKSPPFLPAGRLLFLLLSLLIIAVSASGAIPTGDSPAQSYLSNPGNITVLETGKSVDCEIAGWETQQFQIDARAGQYVSVIVEQRGVDLEERLFSPDGKLLAEYDRELRPQEKEQAIFVAEADGAYRLDVKNKFRNASGRYEIRVDGIRTAGEKDRQLFEAYRTQTQAAILTRAARYAEALPLAGKAIESAETALGPDDALVGYLRNQLGELLYLTAEFTKSEEQFKRARAINETAVGAESPETAYSINGLGRIYDQENDFAKADELLQQALRIVEKTLGPDKPEVAHYLNGLAVLNYERGDFVRAQQELERGVAIFESTLEPDAPALVPVLSNLGLTYISEKQFDRAEATLQRSLAIGEKSFGRDNAAIGLVLQNLGLIAQDHKRDYTQALNYYWRAEKNLEASLGPEHPQIAPILNNIANIYKSTGDYQKALEMHLRVHAIAEKKLGPYSQLTLVSMGNIARTYAAMGDVTNAVKAQLQTDQVIEKNLSLNLAIGSERQKLAYFDTLADRTSRTISLHVSLAPNDPVAANLAALVVLQRKGRVLDAISGSLKTLRERMNGEDQKLLDDLNTAMSDYARLALNGPGKSAAGDYQKQLLSLSEKKEELESQVSRRSSEFRSQSHEVTLAAVQAALPADSVLIEFVVYRPFNPRADNTQAYGQPHYIACVIHPQGDVQWRELGAAADLEARIAAWRQALSDPLRRDQAELSRAVDEKLMQPLRGLLGPAAHLLISPDGALNLIPFAALVDEHGKYLVESRTITYLTSGRDLLRLQVGRDSRTAPVVVADPAFGEPSLLASNSAGKSGSNSSNNRVDYSQIFFGPLPGVADEVRALKELMPSADFVLKERATKAALEKLGGPKILHVATHGFFLSEQGSTTARTGATRSVSATSKIANPLLRSGLALAGANQSGNNDGVLTALEAAGLNLWGTKLVVLSACDTGIGEVKNGDGVYGLRRAFVLAGAESQLMSLWSVSDRSTRDLIIGYYRALLSGAGRSAALRQTQLQMLKVKPHPYYWASFIESGAWSNLEGN